MTTSPLPFYTRSARETDWKCKYLRYLLTEAPTSKGATGLTPATRGLALDEGSLLHEVMPRVLAAGEDVHKFEIAVADAMDFMRHSISWVTETARLEQSTMIEGLMRAAYKLIRPRILEEYDVLSVEKELLMEHHGVLMGAKPDGVLRRKTDGALVYGPEWKSTGNLGPQWFDSWETAVQMQWGAKAISLHFGEPCETVLVQALYKGRNHKEDGLSSIFAYGYAPFKRTAEMKLSYAYTRGWRKYPLWEEPGGIKQWVEEMPTEVLMTQMPEARPISVRTALLEPSLRQTAMREKEIAEAGAEIRQRLASDSVENRRIVTDLLDRHFPQTFSACRPVFGGYECSYKELCFNPVAARMPEKFGFVPRVPHHEQEKQLKGF